MNLEEFSTLEKLAILIGLILFAVVLVPFLVVVQTLLYMLIGWLLKVLAGSVIVHGAAALGITIEAADLPYIVAVIGWVGSFFKSRTNVNKDTTSKFKKLFD